MESVLYLRRNDSGELCIATNIPPLSEPIVTLIEVTADEFYSQLGRVHEKIMAKPDAFLLMIGDER